MDLLQVGGIVGAGFAALVGWFKYNREVGLRPVHDEKLREKIRSEIELILPFQNGERNEIEQALSFLATSNKGNRKRIDAIEEDLRSYQREHANLLDQTRDLRIQLNRLRDEQATP